MNHDLGLGLPNTHKHFNRSLVSVFGTHFVKTFAKIIQVLVFGMRIVPRENS